MNVNFDGSFLDKKDYCNLNLKKRLNKFYSSLPVNKSVKKEIINFNILHQIKKDNYIDKKFEKEFDSLHNIITKQNIQKYFTHPQTKKTNSQSVKKDNISSLIIVNNKSNNQVSQKSEEKDKIPDIENLLQKNPENDKNIMVNHITFYKKFSLSSLIKKNNENYKNINDIKNLENYDRIKIDSMFTPLLNKKKEFFKNKYITNYLNKTFFDDSNIPILLPTTATFEKKYKNKSEQNRNETNMRELNKLAYFLKNRPKMSKKLIKEFQFLICFMPAP